MSITIGEIHKKFFCDIPEICIYLQEIDLKGYLAEREKLFDYESDKNIKLLHHQIQFVQLVKDIPKPEEAYKPFACKIVISLESTDKDLELNYVVCFTPPWFENFLELGWEKSEAVHLYLKKRKQ